MDEASKEFNIAMKINPNLAETYYQMGKTYEELKRYQEGLKPLKKAIQLKPKHI
jgi:Cytochrome c biogenesis factor